jgi:hypothetical protein
MNSLTQALGKDIGQIGLKATNWEAQKLKRVAYAGLYYDRAVFLHMIQETVIEAERYAGFLPFGCPKRPSTLWCHFLRDHKAARS